MGKDELDTSEQGQLSSEDRQKPAENNWPDENWTSDDWERFFADDEDEPRPPRIPRWISSILIFLVMLGFLGLSFPIISPLLFDKMDFLNQNIELSQDPIVEQTRQAVVGITATGSTAGSQRTGTGFCVSEDGWVLTNVHVVKDAAIIKVVLANGKEYYALQSHQLGSYDIAALKIKADNLPYVPIKQSVTVKPGDDITLVGNPLGFMRIAIRGPVVAVSKYDPTDQGGMLEIAASIRPGSSGSPMVDSKGQAIGIIFGLRQYQAGNKQMVSAMGLSFDLVKDELIRLGIVKN